MVDSRRWVRAGYGWKWCEKHKIRYEGFRKECPICEKGGD